LPNSWYIFSDEEVLTVFKPKHERTKDFVKIVVEKQIVVTQDQLVKCFIKDFYITEECLGVKNNILSSLDVKLQNLIDILNSKYVCSGGPNAQDYPGMLVIVNIVID